MKKLILISSFICIICAIFVPIYTTWYALSLNYTIKYVVYLNICTSVSSISIIFMIIKSIKNML